MTKHCFKEALNIVDFSDFPMDVTFKLDKHRIHTSLHGCVDMVTKEPVEMVLTRPLIITTSVPTAIKYLYWNVQEVILHEVAVCFYANRERLHDPRATGVVGNILKSLDAWEEGYTAVRRH